MSFFFLISDRRTSRVTFTFLCIFGIFIFILTLRTHLLRFERTHNPARRFRLQLDSYDKFHTQNVKSHPSEGANIKSDSHSEWKENYTELWNRLDAMISNSSLYPADFDTSIAASALQNARIEHVDLFKERSSLKFIIMLEGGQKVIFKPAVL